MNIYILFYQRGQMDAININVINLNKNEVLFLMRRDSKIENLARAYASRYGVSMNSLIFFHHGNRINIDLTSDELGLKDNCILDVVYIKNDYLINSI